MTVSKVQLVGGNFQDAEGNLLVNGYLKMFLSQDGVVTGVGNICSGIGITIQLDVNGSVSVTPPQYVWGNDVLSPVNTYYKVTGYTAAGQPAWGPNIQQVVGTGTFDVGTWIPNQVISWFPPVQSTVIEINGGPSSAQSTLNLIAGSNITLTDEGGGNIEIIASGGFPSGSTVALLPPAIGGAGNLGGYTMVLVIPAGMVLAIGNQVRVGLSFYGLGIPVIQDASIGATVPNPTPSIGGFSYNYAWTTPPVPMTWPVGSFANSNQIYLSNPVSVTVDTEHDYYITIHLDPSNAGLSPYNTAATEPWENFAGYVEGDHTADTDASLLVGKSQGIFIAQVVVA
jgi:hypothetical protein